MSRFSDGSQAQTRLLQWLVDAGALLEGVRIGPSALGGLGAFGTSRYRQGQRLFQIPQKCVITTRVASESFVGLAANAAAAHLSEDVNRPCLVGYTRDLQSHNGVGVGGGRARACT